MGVITSALTKLYILGVADAAIANQADYEGLTAVEVGEIEDMGGFGDEANIVTFTALNNRRVRKLKGSFDGGNMELQLGRDLTDLGQAALKAAQAADDDYGFKVTFNDEGTGSPSSPTTVYFRAKVTSFTTSPGNADSILAAAATLAITSEFLEIAAV